MPGLNMTKAPSRPVIPESAKKLMYGLKFQPLVDGRGRPVCLMPDVLIEREILRNYERFSKIPKIGDGNLMSWEEHFKKFVTHILGRQDWEFRWFWNPYSNEILNHVRKERLLAVSGHASSGKSAFQAMYAVAMFLLHPNKTKILVTSTSYKEAEGRVWGEIERMWAEVERYFIGLYTSLKLPPLLPGKLVASGHKIVCLDENTGKPNNLGGITLVAGGKGQDATGVSTLIGFKAENLILLADELPLLTHSLYGATANLKVNENFQMLATGNLTSIFDPFGLFAEPEGGWDKVTEHHDGWRTKVGGYCIRFDGEKSPNVQARKNIYKGLLTFEYLDQIKEENGARSPEYYRMVKSFPCPTGAADTIYSEPELVKNLCEAKVTQWLVKPTPVAFLDPSFSSGGDAAAASFGLFGIAQINGVTKQVLEKTDTIDLMTLVDARHKTKDRNEQLADLYIAECDKRGVAIENRGIDATGGGDPFASLLAMKMGHGFQLVSFAGAASDMVVSATDKRKGKDRFFNRVSELWYVGKEFVASGQIRGMDPATMMELCARIYFSRNSKVQVEPKDDMKARTNRKSPDRADSWVGLIEVCRRRFKFTAAAKAAVQPKPVGPERPFWMPPPPPKPSFRDDYTGDSDFGSRNAGWGDNN